MKNSPKLKFALIILAIAWGIFVIAGYFFQIKPHSTNNGGSNKSSAFDISIRSSHRYYLDAFKNLAIKGQLTHLWKINPIIYVILLLFCVYCLYVVLQNHRGVSEVDIHAPPILFLGLFSFTFFLIYYAFLAYYKAGSDVSLLLFFRNYLWRLLEILILSTVICSTGKSIYEFLSHKKEDDLLNLFMFSFAFGALPVIFLTFLLGLFGQINQTACLICFTVLGILSAKNILFWVKQLFTRSIDIKDKYFSPQVFLLLMILIFASYNFLNLSRPIPIGHDELEQYMNMSNLMASQGKLLSGELSYPWQLMISNVLSASESINLAMIFSSLSGFLVLLVIYKVVKVYCVKRKIKAGYYPLLAATLFFTLPAVVFQLSLDIKMDLPAMFFAGLSLLMFWQWKEDVAQNRKLFIAAFLAGFAFLIKPTLILFIVALLLYLVIILFRKKVALKKSLLLILFSMIFAFLPFIPFGIKNSTELLNKPSGKIAFSSFLSGDSGKAIITLNPAEKKVAEDSEAILQSNREAELSRYGSFKQGIAKYLFYPLIVTFNSTVSGQYVDIGFLFLLFIPLLFLIILFKKRRYKNAEFLKDTVIIAAAYFLLWATFCKGVIWYGFPGFIFLSILITEFFNQTEQTKNRLLITVVNLIIIFWLLINLVFRTTLMPQHSINIDKNNLLYAGGKVSGSEYYSHILPTFYGITTFLNGEIDNKQDPPKIYLIGKYVRFFIHDNNKTVYPDNELYAYLSISEGKSGPEIIDRMKADGIKFVIVEDNISFFGDSAGILRVRLVELETTIRDNPDKVKVLLDERSGGILFAKIL